MALLDTLRNRVRRPAGRVEQSAPDGSALPTDRDELVNLAKSYTWVHTIDLGGSYTTPGQWGRGNPEITRAFDAIDFRGKRVLDIGCWDGQWSFEAESRGAAEIVATDLISQRDFKQDRTFEVAAALRGSKAIYIPDLSVYDIETLKSDFDVVLFMGVYYHLKDPIKAFTAVRRVLRDQGQLLTEGAILTEPGCFARFYYKERFCGDDSNWWVPTKDCLRQWIECSFLQIRWEAAQWGVGDNQRSCIIAEAVRGPDPVYIRSPESLEQFNIPAPL